MAEIDPKITKSDTPPSDTPTVTTGDPRVAQGPLRPPQ